MTQSRRSILRTNASMKLLKVGALLPFFSWSAAVADSAMTEFYPGQEAFLESKSTLSRFAVVFEDDGNTGYFYALDATDTNQKILDALHIYNVDNVTDKDKSSIARIVWSATGEQAALLINDYPHAVFDFAAKRGYCRSGFPPPSPNWSSGGHDWDDAAMAFFK